MLQRHAQLRQWPLEVPATRQGCSKDRQEAQTPPLLCVMHHRCKKKKKHTQTASKIAVQGQTAVQSFAVSSTRDKRLRRTTSSTTTSDNLQRAFHSPRQRAVTQHKRESRGKASGRQRNVSRACQLPLFCWVVFMSRALSRLTALFLRPPHHSVSGDKDDCTSKKNRVRSTRSLRVTLPAHCGKHAQEQHFTMLHRKVERREAVESRDSCV